MKQPSNTTQVAIVGGGFGALITYAVLLFRGLSKENIRVFAPESDPTTSWLGYAQAIFQRGMRSESVSHMYPTDSPGLATVEALKNRSIMPIIRQWFDLYHPSIEFLVSHAKDVAQKVSFRDSLVSCMIARVTRDVDGTYLLHDTDGKICGRAKHLIIAIGHGVRNEPKFLHEFKQHNPDDTRVHHSFERKQYQINRAYAVIGDGLTAAAEWMNILDAGGTVLAVSRRAFTIGQALNTPRKYFSKRGLTPYQDKPEITRHQELMEATKGTIPGYYWDQMFGRAHKEGRLHLLQGDVSGIHAHSSHLDVFVETAQGRNKFHVDAAICATGFMPASTHPLIAQMIKDLALPVNTAGYLLPDEMLTIAENMYVIGSAAAWAIPSADSLSGMKIAARRIARTIAGPERPLQQLRAWVTLFSHKTV